jgi:hypothetical protein
MNDIPQKKDGWDAITEKPHGREFALVIFDILGHILTFDIPLLYTKCIVCI